MEFPHLQRLIAENQFDTIYHEHFCYFSFVAVERIFAAHGLDDLRRRGAADARRVAAHLRAPCRERCASRSASACMRCVEREIEDGFLTLERYRGFDEQVKATKRKLLAFLIDAKQRGQEDRRLRRAGQRQHASQLLRHPHRLSRLHRRRESLQAGQVHSGHAHPDPRARADPRGAPGLRADPSLESKEEISRAVAYIGEWGGRFVVPIPEVRVL